MKDQEIDLLIMQNDNQYLGGYVRYFTDIPSEQAYPVTVIFSTDEEMTVITSGGDPTPPLPPEWAVRGVKQRIAAPYFRSLNYTHDLDANIAVKVIKDSKAKKLGIVGFGTVSAAFYQHLKDNLNEVEIVNATDLVDEIKAIKSETEIRFIRKAVHIHDVAMSAVPTILRPGRNEYEIRAELQKILVELGSEEQLIMLGSEVHGKRTPHFHSFYQNRQIQAGDNLMIMIEANGPGGYYAEIGRTWCLGEPTKELLYAWDVALEAQKLAASLLKPGARPGDILKTNNDFMVSKGYQPEGRLFGHGQGYDLVERPALVESEDIELKSGMVLAVHPIAFNDQAYAFCCDNYLITDTGVELLQKTPQKIMVIE